MLGKCKHLMQVKSLAAIFERDRIPELASLNVYCSTHLPQLPHTQDEETEAQMVSNVTMSTGT